MQTYDELNRIKSAETGTNEQLSRKAGIELEGRETSRVVIGKMPAYRQLVMINGLVYRVKFINHKTGDLSLSLVRKANKADEALAATVAGTDFARGNGWSTEQDAASESAE